jgi:hypothetical protein
MSTIKKFEELEVWQKSREQAKEIWELSTSLINWSIV